MINQKIFVPLIIIITSVLMGLTCTNRPSKEKIFTEKTTQILQNKLVPIKTEKSEFRPLNNFFNKSFEQSLKLELYKNSSYKYLLENNLMSIGLVDLNNPEQPKYANVNGDVMLYAASLPKIAVLLAVEDALDKKELLETEAIRSDMHLMISKSNNAATTRLIDLVGFEKIENTLRAPVHQFYDEDTGGGLWVGKRYSKQGVTNREPLKNLSHAATAHQVCRFYYQLAFGQLINYERSKEMLQIMSNPGLSHKFVYELQKNYPKSNLYRKSGSWKNWHSDSILVWDEDQKYILVALLQHPEGESLIRNLISPIENVLSQL